MSTGGLLEDECMTSAFDFNNIGTVNEKSDDESESSEFLRGMATGHSGSGDGDVFGNGKELSNGEELVGNEMALPLDLVLASSDTANVMEWLSVSDMECLTVVNLDSTTISEFPRSLCNWLIHIKSYQCQNC